MNEVWDLSPLYKDFDDAFEADLAALKEAIDAFGDYVKTLSEVEPVEGLREGVRYQERILDLADRLGAYPRLRQSTNTRDTEARSQLGRIQTVTSSNAGTLAAFRQWAVSLPDLQQLVASDELLKEYTFYFDSMVSSARYQLPGSSEELIEKLERFIAIDEGERRQMGLRGRSKMEREFDREIVIEKYIQEAEA